MKYIIKSTKVKKNIKIEIYSDIHYVPKDNLKFLKKRLEKIKTNPIDYIFILGDLIDDSNYNIDELKDLIDLLSNMTKYSKVILILGNHDQFTKQKTGKWEEYYNTALINELKRIGIIILENSFYKDEFINVYGTKFSSKYYQDQEPTEQFLKEMKKIKFNNSKKFNILLEHSPYRTFNKKLMNKTNLLNNVDLVLAGHYHNGCIPWYISNIIPGNFGLIDPHMKLFPKIARGKIKITNKCHGIISLPIKTIANNSSIKYLANNSQIFNKLYPPRKQIIIIKPTT